MGRNILVTGAGGFIGHHLVNRLKDEGNFVRGVDIKYPDYESTRADEFWLSDLRDNHNANQATRDIDDVYALAADMGGIGYITAHLADIARNNTLINLNTLENSRLNGVQRYLYTSSACVYAHGKQQDANVIPLKEGDAYPAQPEPGYGWEKLYAEEMCNYYEHDYNMDVRIVRFHNVYGPCFDDKTEILTERGWVLFSELLPSDKVATRNPCGALEYHSPLAIQKYPYKGDMHRIQNRTLDLMITPDHSVLVAFSTSGKRTRTDFSLRKISEIWDKKSHFYFHRGVDSWNPTSISSTVHLEGVKGGGTAQIKGAPKDVALDDWLEFLGWYLSEGSCFETSTNYVVGITQYKAHNRPKIISVIERLGFHPQATKTEILVTSKQLFNQVRKFGHAHDKFIPPEIKALPAKNLVHLFNALMAGDGHSDGSRYSTVSEKLADDFQEIAIKLGYGAIKRLDTENPNHPIFRIALSRRVVHKIEPEHRKMESYEGFVYDVTVPNHVILVRRNGKVVWSGNCGTWDGGREKSPAAICRKVAKAQDGSEIEIWGDGHQTRSYMFIDNCVEGLRRIMESGYRKPLNLGTDELVSINQLVDIISSIAGKTLIKRHDLTAPQGVRGRNSDNALTRMMLNWEPGMPLREGLVPTYQWIKDQIENNKSQG